MRFSIPIKEKIFRKERKVKSLENVAEQRNTKEKSISFEMCYKIDNLPRSKGCCLDLPFPVVILSHS